MASIGLSPIAQPLERCRPPEGEVVHAYLEAYPFRPRRAEIPTA